MPPNLSLLAMVLAASTVGGCGARGGARGPSDLHDEDGIADVDDRCHIVSCGDEFHMDEDGCPDVLLSFDEGSAELDERSRRLLGEARRDLEEIGARLRMLTVLTTYVPPEEDDLAERRGAAIRAFFVAAGVDATVVATTGHAGSATVGPGAWLEAACD